MITSRRLLPAIVRRLRKEAPQLALRVVSGGYRDDELLRRRRGDPIITPHPPDGTEFMQRRLFEDGWACFVDPAVSAALATLKDYLRRLHAKIIFSADEAGPIDHIMRRWRLSRRVTLKVPAFSSLPRLMQGTDLIAILPSRLRASIMSGFGVAPVPFRCRR